ncbi:MAG TPA: class I SAM-dependent methyltransferase [Allosphingosinicella sp.]|jgi:SAM-dependent methyltransferase
MASRSALRPLLAGAMLAALAVAGCRPAGNDTASAGNAAAADQTNLSAASELDIVRAMLDMAGVTREDLVVDLGSGDGRIPIMAARDRGARGLGVEIDPDRIRRANTNAASAGVADRVQFRQQDLFVTPLNDVTVLTLYLLPEINLQLRPRILAQMRPGTRVVSNSWDMGDWRPDRRQTVDNTNIFLWIVPARVEGRWQFQTEGGGGGELVLDQRYQDISGTISIAGRSIALSEGRLSGDQISFTADLGQGQRRYVGLVAGNAITGEGWRATRTGAG